MSTEIVGRRRTGWDIVAAVLLILGGIAILGNAVLATVFSVFLIGWTTLIAGVVLAVGAFFKFKSGGFWSAALGGAVLAVLGLFILRNPLIGAVSLTLLAGALFLVAGVTRLVASYHFAEVRGALIVSGIVSLALGVFVLFNLVQATFTLLGVLLGVQILVEGITLLIAGRTRPVPSDRS